MARIDADDGDERHGEEEEDGKDRNLRLYAVILQDLAAQSKIAHISQPPLLHELRDIFARDGREWNVKALGRRLAA